MLDLCELDLFRELGNGTDVWSSDSSPSEYIQVRNITYILYIYIYIYIYIMQDISKGVYYFFNVFKIHCIVIKLKKTLEAVKQVP